MQQSVLSQAEHQQLPQSQTLTAPPTPSSTQPLLDDTTPYDEISSLDLLSAAASSPSSQCSGQQSVSPKPSLALLAEVAFSLPSSSVTDDSVQQTAQPPQSPVVSAPQPPQSPVSAPQPPQSPVVSPPFEDTVSVRDCSEMTLTVLGESELTVTAFDDSEMTMTVLDDLEVTMSDDNCQGDGDKLSDIDFNIGGATVSTPKRSKIPTQPTKSSTQSSCSTSATPTTTTQSMSLVDSLEIYSSAMRGIVEEKVNLTRELQNVQEQVGWCVWP